ncbi:MAG: hypothetical protein WBB28_28440, partial [Crinalium sp.]
MKSTDFYEHEQPKAKKRFWLPLLITLPIAGTILVASPLGLDLWKNYFGQPKLNTIYRYDF